VKRLLQGTTGEGCQPVEKPTGDRWVSATIALMTVLGLRLAITVALGFGTMATARSGSAVTMAVGMVTRPYVDTSRMNWARTGPRPLQTEIWYPVDSATRRETIFGGPIAEQIFVPVEVAPAATLSARSQKYPLIVMSHGTGGSAAMMMWLGTYLAANGYIVAAVNHHGNTSTEREPAPQGFLLYWERATDLKMVIDSLLRDPVFGKRIDGRRIGAAGFSLGGYTAIAAAGGRFSQSTFDGFCVSTKRDFTCEPQNEFPEARAKFALLRDSDVVVRESLRRSDASYHDRRIKSVFAIAPALGSGFTADGLRPVNVPVHIVVGNGDTVAPPLTNADRYVSLIKGAKLTVLPGAVGHYTFLHECTPRGVQLLAICQDAPGVNRRAIHESVRELALIFFNSVLTEGP
jgi:predicted dienelactone hydrolase